MTVSAPGSHREPESQSSLPLSEVEQFDLLGIDFSSSPTRKKPVAVVHARWEGPVLKVQSALSLPTLPEFETLMRVGVQAQPGAAPQADSVQPFLAVIDMPFGLSRELVDGLNWPGARRSDHRTWVDLMTFYSKLSRADIRTTFKAWCDARPAGQKFAHRYCDKPAGSSPSMKWVNPPVAYMLHAGAPLLQKAGVFIPGMHRGDERRIALEGYPGYWARQILGRQSYKSDDTAKDTADRRMARSELLCALEEGMVLGIRMAFPRSVRGMMLEDPKADHLDAALCALVAGWCAKRADQRFGLPLRVDPVEGWIAGIPV